MHCGECLRTPSMLQGRTPRPRAGAGCKPVELGVEEGGGPAWPGREDRGRASWGHSPGTTRRSRSGRGMTDLGRDYHKWDQHYCCCCTMVTGWEHFTVTCGSTDVALLWPGAGPTQGLGFPTVKGALFASPHHASLAPCSREENRGGSFPEVLTHLASPPASAGMSCPGLKYAASGKALGRSLGSSQAEQAPPLWPVGRGRRSPH